MAKIEKIVHGDFDTILDTIHRAVLKKVLLHPVRREVKRHFWRRFPMP